MAAVCARTCVSWLQPNVYVACGACGVYDAVLTLITVRAVHRHLGVAHTFTLDVTNNLAIIFDRQGG